VDSLEPNNQQVSASAQAKPLFVRISEDVANRAWAERNAESLTAHGRDIAATGLAGAEFDRI